MECFNFLWRLISATQRSILFRSFSKCSGECAQWPKQREGRPTDREQLFHLVGHPFHAVDGAWRSRLLIGSGCNKPGPNREFHNKNRTLPYQTIRGFYSSAPSDIGLICFIHLNIRILISLALLFPFIVSLVSLTSPSFSFVFGFCGLLCGRSFLVYFILAFFHSSPLVLSRLSLYSS